MAKKRRGGIKKELQKAKNNKNNAGAKINIFVLRGSFENKT